MIDKLGIKNVYMALIKELSLDKPTLLVVGDAALAANGIVHKCERVEMLASWKNFNTISRIYHAYVSADDKGVYISKDNWIIRLSGGNDFSEKNVIHINGVFYRNNFALLEELEKSNSPYDKPIIGLLRRACAT